MYTHTHTHHIHYTTLVLSTYIHQNNRLLCGNSVKCFAQMCDTTLSAQSKCHRDKTVRLKNCMTNMTTNYSDKKHYHVKKCAQPWNIVINKQAHYKSTVYFKEDLSEEEHFWKVPFW